MRVTQEYDANNAEGNVGEFLQQIALLADADTIRDDEGLVTLMTLHNAKGLEFPIVFIIGMEDGTFPHSRSIEEGNIDEERRLAYVGLTRAMRDLTLTYARRRGAFGGSMGGPTIRSRFLDEIPRELTDQKAAHGGRLPGAGPRRVLGGRGRGQRRGGRTTRRARCSASARTSSTPSSATASSRASSRAGSSSCASPGDGSERKLMADYAPLKRRANRTPSGVSRLVRRSWRDLASARSDAQAPAPRLRRRPRRHVVLRGDHAAAARSDGGVRPVQDRRGHARRGLSGRDVRRRAAGRHAGRARRA